MELSQTGREFVVHWGEMGARWGVNRTVAQVHAMLYLADTPVTADEIAEQLSVARSNVSTSLRELQNWELVQISHHLGDRRDFFSTSHDVWQLFLTVLRQRVEREIEPTIAVLGRLAEEREARTPAKSKGNTASERGENAKAKQAQATAERIETMHRFLREMHGWYRQMEKLPPATLRKLIGLGAGVTRWLPEGKKAKA